MFGIRTHGTPIGLAAALAALALAAPVSAATYRVAGKQTAIDADAGMYKVSGGLVGKWTQTSFDVIAESPIFQGKGTEVFEGCLDRRRDRSCKGDPQGTLSFTFEYWAMFASPDPASLVWGACWHPVASGTGDFAGARGRAHVRGHADARGRQDVLHRQPHAEGREARQALGPPGGLRGPRRLRG